MRVKKNLPEAAFTFPRIDKDLYSSGRDIALNILVKVMNYISSQINLGKVRVTFEDVFDDFTCSADISMKVVGLEEYLGSDGNNSDANSGSSIKEKVKRVFTYIGSYFKKRHYFNEIVKRYGDILRNVYGLACWLTEFVRALYIYGIVKFDESDNDESDKSNLNMILEYTSGDDSSEKVNGLIEKINRKDLKNEFEKEVRKYLENVGKYKKKLKEAILKLTKNVTKTKLEEEVNTMVGKAIKIIIETYYGSLKYHAVKYWSVIKFGGQN